MVANFHEEVVIFKETLRRIDKMRRGELDFRRKGRESRNEAVKKLISRHIIDIQELKYL